jgi:hypothetical protein
MALADVVFVMEDGTLKLLNLSESWAELVDAQGPLHLVNLAFLKPAKGSSISTPKRRKGTRKVKRGTR